MMLAKNLHGIIISSFHPGAIMNEEKPRRRTLREMRQHREKIKSALKEMLRERLKAKGMWHPKP
jgi:hypothetical protein